MRSAVAVLVFVLATAIWADQPPAGSQETGPEYGTNAQNYISWNLCQSACPRNDGRHAPADELQDRVVLSTTSPRAVAAQEICQDSYDVVQSNLAYLGFRGRFFQAKISGSCPEGVGNAIFWRAACEGLTSTCIRSEPFSSRHPDDTAGSEVRGYACGRAPTRDAWYCSAHITSKGETVRSNQLGEYRTLSRDWREAGKQSVMMGDFNTRPYVEGVGILLWYDHHRESDLCNLPAGSPYIGCDYTHDVEPGHPELFDRKFDFIFANQLCPRHTPPIDGNPIELSSLSDHSFLRGYFACPA